MYCYRLFVNLARNQKKNVINNIVVLKHKQSFFQQIRKLGNIHDESDMMIQQLCKGDEIMEKKLRILMLEVEVMRQDGRLAPNTIKTTQWEHLLQLGSRNQRNNYLLYLWKTEKSKENQKAKKEAKKKEMELMKPEEIKEYADDLLYGIKHQSLFLRIRDQSINNFDNYKSLQSIQYGQPIIIDCSYEQHMVYRENVNAAKQMTFMFGDNRMHKDPYNIHMCNVNNNGEFMKQLRKNIPSIDEPWFPINIHAKSYLDIFPKNKLVYLTPHCREELTEYDHDAIYIIGCMVDKVNNEPLSLAKAKRDGLKMSKLPLDRYIEWGPGAKKNLNINHMVLILLDLKLTGDWDVALKHIPRRKLMSTTITTMQNKIQNKALREAVFENSKHDRKFVNNDYKRKNKMTNLRKTLLYDDNKF
ncbi:hypothetical protein ACJJTC_007992 [Scirpophaga incertulas]